MIKKLKIMKLEAVHMDDNDRNKLKSEIGERERYRSSMDVSDPALMPSNIRLSALSLCLHLFVKQSHHSEISLMVPFMIFLSNLG